MPSRYDYTRDTFGLPRESDAWIFVHITVYPFKYTPVVVLFLVGLYTHVIHSSTFVRADALGQLILIWFNLNPSMER